MTATAALRAHYRDLFAQHGDRPAGAQMSAEGQRFRFERLFGIGDLAGKTVLDVGSGLGAMYPALREHCPTASYEGIDVVPETVACAAVKYPGVRFRVADLLEGPLPERYDYVLLSVVFNNAMPDATGFLESLVRRAWDHATVGLGFNFLSNRVNFAQAEMAYHDPARIFDFCLGLTRRVTLQHHYERCDVAVYLYR